ncbi:hypothetical protein [Rhodococcus marinonascens]|uniref:hypothetical protein n=1 Tax=Rhodococcus marinonascens TaxID=38311 RepID=UPI00093273F8|nr:hypothetical protein [Rhodococcus marinonascens]
MGTDQAVLPPVPRDPIPPTPSRVGGIVDAIRIFLGTVSVKNIRRGYIVVLNRMERDFGKDANVALSAIESA